MKQQLKLILLSGAMIIGAQTAQAQTCATQPSCAELGYTLTSTSDCIGTVLKCPFNKSQYYCTTKTEALNMLTLDIVTAGVPDYSKREERNVNTEYTATSNGYITGSESMRGDAGAGCDATIRILVNEKNVRGATTQVNWSTNSWSYPVKKGAKYKYSYSAPACNDGVWTTFYFIPTK